MVLAGRNEGQGREYMLVMSPAEFERAVAGETIKRPTMCRKVSGTWEVRFVKNSDKKHKLLSG